MTAMMTILVLAATAGLIVGFNRLIKGRVKHTKLKNRKIPLFLMVAILVTTIMGCASVTEDPKSSPTTNEDNKTAEVEEITDQEPNTDEAVVIPTGEGTLDVHFVDIGQGQAQVIVTPNNKVMVIDGGNNDDEQLMVDYLTNLGVTKIDILIGTHPDADHIGGLDAVINAFDVGKVYMPKIQKDTKTFEDVLLAVQNKGLKVTTAQAGIDLDLDPVVEAKMIAPVMTSTDYNEMSAVVRLQYGNQSFLLMGDAGTESEAAIIDSGVTLQSTVLLVGHHGSDHSTSDALLQAVQPQYAVIQVGENNSYGHPTNSVLKRLAAANAEIYRNDTDGTIVFKTNGEKIEVNKNAWTYTPTVEETKDKGSETKLEDSPKIETVETPGTNDEVSGLEVSASIEDPTPIPNGSVTVTVTVHNQDGQPVSGADVALNLAFKSTNTIYKGQTNSDGTATLTFRIGRAAKGYTVEGDISITYQGQTAKTQTAFTPQ